LPARWEHFEHAADVGVRGIGPSREAAFEQAAIAMMAAVTDPERIAPTTRVDITCRGRDAELLLVAWLNAIIYEVATRHMVFGRFHVRFEGDRLIGAAWGEPVSTGRHQPATELKGATYTEARVQQANGHWLAQCVVDV
jgi:tRNA nucleotidyltransferase (CCA-adding enzyme)